jgi:hypothetical protein
MCIDKNGVELANYHRFFVQIWPSNFVVTEDEKRNY